MPHVLVAGKLHASSRVAQRAGRIDPTLVVNGAVCHGK